MSSVLRINPLPASLEKGQKQSSISHTLQSCGSINKIDRSSIHSICYRLLRENGSLRGYAAFWRVRRGRACGERMVWSVSLDGAERCTFCLRARAREQPRNRRLLLSLSIIDTFNCALVKTARTAFKLLPPGWLVLTVRVIYEGVWIYIHTGIRMHYREAFLLALSDGPLYTHTLAVREGFYVTCVWYILTFNSVFFIAKWYI